MSIRAYSFLSAILLASFTLVKAQGRIVLKKSDVQFPHLEYLPHQTPQPGGEPVPDPDVFVGAERSKIIIKTYKADGGEKVNLSNQYGNILVNTWSKSEIRVQVEIKAFEASESKANELLESVSIAESKSGNQISFSTGINRHKFGNSWWGIKKVNGREEKRGVQVNYTVFMPSKTSLDLANQYGAIELPDYSGVVNVVSAYGSLRAANLSNPQNVIKVSYGSADIESWQSGSLDISYGSLKLGAANKIDASVSYSSAKIGRISGEAELNLKYCSGFKIAEIDNRVKNLNVKAAYSTVSLGFDRAASFEFDVTVSYCGFKYEEDKINIISTSPDSNKRGFQPTKNYKGQIGKRSDAKVTVNSRYGSVQFL